MPDGASTRLFERFCDRSLPKTDWTHEAHLTACWVALSTRSEAEALEFLRDAIRSYNTATGVENTATEGYHETLTAYYVHAVASVDAAAVDDVFAASECSRDAPLAHWSRERLFGELARAQWVEPDLAPLAHSA